MGAVALDIVGGLGIGPGGVPPVVIVVSGDAIPPPVVVLDGRVLPGQSGVVPGQHGALAGETQGPHVVGVDEGDVPFHAQHVFQVLGMDLGLVELVAAVGGDAGHVGAGRQVKEQFLAAAPDEDLVADVERLVADPLGVQVCPQLFLGAFGGGVQRLKDEAPLFLFGFQLVSWGEVGLFGQPYEEIGSCRFGLQLLEEQRFDF